MGGGDLNMKKSWHPLLKVNQEKVWKQEKKALDERRKLEELRREREQERELQELQRLQEASGGKKRAEKVDWMYATPSSGQGPSANELEDYLLGKKSVDKLLQQKDTPVASSSNAPSQASFMAIQNANNPRDMASKIRADPLLAIKQQEQAAYQALLKDPVRLRQLQEANGIVVGETKEEKRKRKEEKRRAKEERRAERESKRSSRHHRDRDYSDDDEHPSRRHGSSSRRSRSRSPPPRRRSYSPSSPPARRRDDEDRYYSRKREDEERNDWRRRYESDRRRDYDGEERRSSERRDVRYDRRSPPPARSRYEDRDRDRNGHPHRDRASEADRRYRDERPSDGERRPSPPARLPPPGPPPSRPAHMGGGERRVAAVQEGPTPESLAAERAAKLAAMQAAASSLTAQRSVQLAKIKAEEDAESAREEAAKLRAKLRAGGGKGESKEGGWDEGGAKGSFLLAEQSKMFGVGAGGASDMDLAERVRRGKGRLEKLADE
ncbi:RNA-splicing factor [Tilletia horrida]|nr:RNA-splicing factor [Tilletia horrida]